MKQIKRKKHNRYGKVALILFLEEMEKFASFCEVIGSCTESLGQVKFLQIFLKK